MRTSYQWHLNRLSDFVHHYEDSRCPIEYHLELHRVFHASIEADTLGVFASQCALEPSIVAGEQLQFPVFALAGMAKFCVLRLRNENVGR